MGSGWVGVLGIPGPNPTHIYYFFLKKKTLSIDTHFSNPKSLRPILSPSHSLPSRFPFSPSPLLSLSLSLEQDRFCSFRRRRSILHLIGLSSLPPSPYRSLQTLLLLPHLARPSSTSQGRNSLISLTTL